MARVKGEQTTATLPPTTLEAVRAMAERERRTLSSMIAILLDEAIDARRKGPGWFPAGGDR